MEKQKRLGVGAKQFLFALLSFLVFLLFYALFLVLEAILGGGRAFLWFLILVPLLFVFYHLCIGALCFRATQNAGATVLYQFLATLAADLVVVIVNLATDRFGLGDGEIWLWLFDVCILLCQPVLCFCGTRFLRIFRAIRALRARPEDVRETRSEHKEEL